MICKCISYQCVRNGAVVQDNDIMWQSGGSDLFKKLLNKFPLKWSKTSLYDQFLGHAWIYFFLIQIRKKINSEVCVKYLTGYSIFSNKHTWHSLKSRYSIIHLNPNVSTFYKSSITLRIIQHSTNLSTLYKSFRVVRIIQYNANHLIKYKSFNVV